MYYAQPTSPQYVNTATPLPMAQPMGQPIAQPMGQPIVQPQPVPQAEFTPVMIKVQRNGILTYS